MSAATMTNSKNLRAGNTHNSRPRQGARKATAYCKVCQDAGRPHSEYTSHFVKDKKGPEGKVVCPLLLNQECRYCHEKGHTPKECPQIKANAKRNQQHLQRQCEFNSRPDDQGFRSADGLRSHRIHRPAAASKPRVPADAARMQRANLFAALRESSSDEETAPTKDAFPALGTKSPPSIVVPPEPKLTEWAALASKPAAAAPKPVVQSQEPTTKTRDKESEYFEDEYDRTEREAQWKLDYDRMKNMSWADMCDSHFEDRSWGDYDSDSSY